MDSGRFEAVEAALRELFQREYNRGVQDVLQRIVATMKGSPRRASPRVLRPRVKRRATRGSARALIERVLKEQKAAAVPKIVAAAKSPAERRVSVAAIRFELYKGKKERRYRNNKGQWSLPVSRPAKAK